MRSCGVLPAGVLDDDDVLCGVTLFFFVIHAVYKSSVSKYGERLDLAMA